MANLQHSLLVKQFLLIFKSLLFLSAGVALPFVGVHADTGPSSGPAAVPSPPLNVIRPTPLVSGLPFELPLDCVTSEVSPSVPHEDLRESAPAEPEFGPVGNSRFIVYPDGTVGFRNPEDLHRSSPWSRSDSLAPSRFEVTDRIFVVRQECESLLEAQYQNGMNSLRVNPNAQDLFPYESSTPRLYCGQSSSIRACPHSLPRQSRGGLIRVDHNVINGPIADALRPILEERFTRQAGAVAPRRIYFATPHDRGLRGLNLFQGSSGNPRTHFPPASSPADQTPQADLPSRAVGSVFYFNYIYLFPAQGSRTEPASDQPQAASREYWLPDSIRTQQMIRDDFRISDDRILELGFQTLDYWHEFRFTWSTLEERVPTDREQLEIGAWGYRPSNLRHLVDGPRFFSRIDNRIHPSGLARRVEVQTELNRVLQLTSEVLATSRDMEKVEVASAFWWAARRLMLIFACPTGSTVEDGFLSWIEAQPGLQTCRREYAGRFFDELNLGTTAGQESAFAGAVFRAAYHLASRQERFTLHRQLIQNLQTRLEQGRFASVPDLEQIYRETFQMNWELANRKVVTWVGMQPLSAAERREIRSLLSLSRQYLIRARAHLAQSRRSSAHSPADLRKLQVIWYHTKELLRLPSWSAKLGRR
jgi:hypothetical protein